MRSGVMNRQPFGGRYAPIGGGFLTSNSTAPKFMTPTGAEVGDVLVACVSWESLAVMTPAAGWTMINESLHTASAQTLGTYWRVHGSESMQEVFTLSVSAVWVSMVMICKHINRFSPIIISAETENVSSATMTFPAITPGEKAVLVGVVGSSGGRHIVNSPPGWSRLSKEPAQTINITSKDTTVGPELTPTFIGSLSSSTFHAIQTIALRPAS